MLTPIDGRRRFRGVLEGFADGEARLFLPAPEAGGEDILVGLSFDDIAEARLVMTDKLIDDARNKVSAAPTQGSEWTTEYEDATTDGSLTDG